MKLLIKHRRLRHFLRYLCGLPNKLARRPSMLFWEAVGAARYIKRPRRPAARGDRSAMPIKRPANHRRPF